MKIKKHSKWYFALWSTWSFWRFVTLTYKGTPASWCMLNIRAKERCWVKFWFCTGTMWSLSFLRLLSSFSIVVNGHQLCFSICRCVTLSASVAQRKTWAGAQWSSHRGINDQHAWLMAQRIVGPCGVLHINCATGGETGESNDPLAFKSI